uniref:CRAL-TRIO domain-containing protein n=2 Tax=Bursaphelenchus xylophilus TaxID=6326 RepID=A0A1I7S2H8_BURXY
MYIMDLDGLHYDKNLISLLNGALASISAFMSEHYVEMVHSFVLVNVPTFISFLWNIAKPLLPHRTRNKVIILDSDWRNEILKLADPEVLPAFWNLPGEDLFKADIKRAVPFEKDGYYKDGIPKDSQLLYVKAASVGSVAVEAEEGQKLSWEFSADGNFAYGIYFSEDPKLENVDLMTAVYPRFNKVPGPTYVPLSDFIICPRTGTYRLWFSNQHAWIHTLKVHYKLETSNE